jgi:pilus assembly protein CpaB
MNIRALLLLVAAAACGGVAVFLARNWIQAQIPEPTIIAEKSVPTTTVVVASRDLFFGDRLARGYLEEREWPASSVPEGGFETVTEALETERVVLRPISKSEPILLTKLSGEGGRATLSSIVDENMRAITIKVNVTTAVAGFVLPGDRVDIMLTRDINGGLVTDFFLQNMKVLGIDQSANDQQDKPKVARAMTFEVTPRQAQMLTLAGRIGTLSLALRNSVNVAPTKSRRITISDLADGEINQSPNADDAPKRPVRTTVSKRAVPEDPFAKVTITRGLSSREYKVRPAPPSTSAYIGFGRESLARSDRPVDLLTSGLPGAVAAPDAASPPAGLPTPFTEPTADTGVGDAPRDLFPSDDSVSAGPSASVVSNQVESDTVATVGATQSQ